MIPNSESGIGFLGRSSTEIKGHNTYFSNADVSTAPTDKAILDGVSPCRLLALVPGV